MILVLDKNIMSKRGIMSTRQTLQRRIQISRGNLILMAVFTIVNILAYWFEFRFMLPFSAFLPFTIFDFGYYFSMELNDPALFTIGIALASFIILVYFLGYFLSNKKPGWLTFMLIMYVFDTVVMIYLFTMIFVFNGSMILDILFHVWVLYYLINGVIAVNRLKALPEEFEELEVVEA